MIWKDQILQDRPFADFITIAEIGDLPIGKSGYACRVRDSQKRWYKLRVCRSVSEAKRYEWNIRSLAGIFPPLYGRDGRYLLLDFVDQAQRLRPLIFAKSAPFASTILHQIGLMLGRTNLIESKGMPQAIDRKFTSRVSRLEPNGIIDSDLAKRALRKFEFLRESQTYQFNKDIRDTKLENFVFSDRVYYVDEEGIEEVRGFGLAHVLRQLQWQPSQPFTGLCRVVMDGYGLINKTPISPEYLQLVSLLLQARRLTAWKTLGIPLKWEKRRFKQLC